MITSTANPRVKAVAALRNRRDRDASGTFPIEGRRAVERALAAGWPLTDAYVAPELLDEAGRRTLALLTDSGVRITELGIDAFHKAAYRRHPDGILAIGAIPDLGLDELDVGAQPLILVVEAIEKPGNLGAMLRTSDAAAVTAVLVADATADPWNPNTVRASQGALFSVPLAMATSEEAATWLDERRIRIVATRLDTTARAPWAIDLTGPVAIVVGSEHAGLSNAWRGRETVHIPMAGTIDSLNASVAAAVIVYEALRQRT